MSAYSHREQAVISDIRIAIAYAHDGLWVLASIIKTSDASGSRRLELRGRSLGQVGVNETYG